MFLQYIFFPEKDISLQIFFWWHVYVWGREKKRMYTYECKNPQSLEQDVGVPWSFYELLNDCLVENWALWKNSMYS